VFGEGNVADPVLCPNGVANGKGTFNALFSYPGIGVSSSNPNLKAVNSKNATYGVIFEPANIFSASVNYYWIQLNDDIISASAARGLGAPFLTLIRGAPATLAPAWYPYCSLAHFTDVNMYVKYAVSDHLLVHGSITNLFNSDAPVDLQTYGGGAELRYDAALDQDGAVGRLFLLGATYRF
jgi:outer membrane receptor protein involved in Fe transport